MGTVKVTIAVGDPQGQVFEDLEVTVDTGSTFTAMPMGLLRRLGVPVMRTAQAELADGSNAPVNIGETVIRLEGRQFHTPVIFAEEGEPSLLGRSVPGGSFPCRGPCGSAPCTDQRAALLAREISGFVRSVGYGLP